MAKKVAVMTPWYRRDNFVPIYNHIWSNKNYENYDVHVFEESNTLLEKKNKFNEKFFIHPIEVNHVSIGTKRNIAFATLKEKNYDYVMMADSDDYYSPDYINVCLDFMESNDVDIINMESANYINLWKPAIEQVYTAGSYGGLFFFKSKLLDFKWNENVRAGEDRRMLNALKRSGIKHICTNVHQSHWLGIIHGNNHNTLGRYMQCKEVDEIKSWLRNYLKYDEFLLNFYFSFMPK